MFDSIAKQDKFYENQFVALNRLNKTQLNRKIAVVFEDFSLQFFSLLKDSKSKFFLFANYKQTTIDNRHYAF